MKRPNLKPSTPEDIDRIYAYYEQYRPPRLVSQFAWRAFDLCYRPHSSFMSDEAEEQFRKIKADGTPHIITSNHLTGIHDQFVHGAVLRQIMPERAGRVRILTKDPVMRALTHFGKAGEALGGVPAYRTKDNHGHGELVQAATQGLTRCCGNLLSIEHDDLFLYPQGTHRSESFVIKPGIAHIALNVAERGEPLAITTTGMSYGPEERRSPRHANVIFGDTFYVEPGMTVNDVVALVRNGQQAATLFAHDSY